MNDSASPLRLGVLGCGRVFERFHLPALARSPAIDLLAACDTDPSRLSGVQNRFSAAALLGSAADLFGYPGLEAVLILTPPESHADAAVQALESGLHVLVEKPMALNPGDARRMAHAARLSQRRLQVGFTRRFREPYRRLREMVRQLDLRDLRALRFELAFPSGSWNARTDFLGDESRGGGVLDDVLSHQVDLICWMLGGLPHEVRATVEGSPDGPLHAELRLGNLEVRCDAAHASYAERLEIELLSGRILEASGSGVRSTGCRFPRWRRRRALLTDRLTLLGHRLLRRPNVTMSSFESQLQDFERAVRGGGFDGASAEEGLLVVEVLQACRESTRQGGAWQAVGLSARPAA